MKDNGFILNLLSERNLPEILTLSDGTPVTCETANKRRLEMLDILQREIYGRYPEKPSEIKGEIIKHEEKRDCAGKARKRKIMLTFALDGAEFSFPFYLAMPKDAKNVPFVVIINFRDCFPDEYIPVEELIDRGIGIAVCCYKDITSDNGDFTDGVADVLSDIGYDDTGKIIMWAYCCSRILDYVLETEENVDRNRIAVAGHSRLGKTALVAAAFDERFTCGYSNDSGCSGAAITRGKVGETVKDITGVFPFWFCKKYRDYADNHEEMPFDQHFLVSAIAPRGVYIASASEDIWADPCSEYLCCHAASPFWSIYQKQGFVAENRLPIVGDTFNNGSIGYHLRKGEHYFSREDWNKFLDYFLK